MKTSLAPGSQVVTDYLAKANLQDDLDALGFNLAGYGCTTCIGNSGPLPDNIADAVRKSRPGGRRGALRQPQLRGPRQRRREGQLPGLAAAGGGLRAGRHAQQGPHVRAARHRQRRPARLPQGHLADLGGDRRADPHLRHARHVRQALRPRVRGRREVAGHGQGQAEPHLSLELGLHLRAEPALLRGPRSRARRRSATSSTRASSACSTTASPPTTSRPPARSRRTARPAST